MLTGAIFFLLAVLSGLGVGSAGLPILWLTLVENIPQLEAQGLGLVFFLFSSGAALLVHVARTPLLGGFVALMLPFGILGALCGAALAGALPQELLRTLFGFFLIASGALGLLGKKRR